MHPWDTGDCRMVVAKIGAGLTIDQLLADYPYLAREDTQKFSMTNGGRRGVPRRCRGLIAVLVDIVSANTIFLARPDTRRCIGRTSSDPSRQIGRGMGEGR